MTLLSVRTMVSWMLFLFTFLASAGHCFRKVSTDQSGGHAFTISADAVNLIDSMSAASRSSRMKSIRGRHDPLRLLTKMFLAPFPSATVRNSISRIPQRVRSKPMMDEAKDPNSMRLKELKAELEKLNVAYKGRVFDKEGLVDLLVEARKNPPSPSPPPSDAQDDQDNRKFDDDVIVGSTTKMKKEGGKKTGGNPFGGGGGNPFAGMGGSPFGGMGGGMGGGNPFGSGMGGMGGNPFGGMGGGMGGMGGDMLQKVMQNPKAMALMQKAQSNPKFMQAMAEIQRDPKAYDKYKGDPEVKSFMDEFQKILR